MFSVVDHSLS